MNRRDSLKKAGSGVLAAVSFPTLANKLISSTMDRNTGIQLKGNIKQSVCRWPYADMPLDDFCKAVKEMGILSVELVGSEEWPILRKYGLYCALPWGAGLGIEKGFNDPLNHDALVYSYQDMILKVAAAGYDTIICFSGNRNGMTDEEGIKNCALGLKRLIPTAEKYKVTLVMELLNSKIDHKDYMCDHTAWGVKLCKSVGSPYFKLLYDIYHMQIMEGDVIRTIRDNIEFIAHFHTGGNPGRNEINDTQELNYPAIMRAILETGFKGYVAQEFIPRNKDKLAALKEGVLLCDV